MGSKSTVISFRAKDAELKLLQRAAKKNSMSLSEFLRAAGLIAAKKGMKITTNIRAA